jgi:prepilin-type N-terminal cleavage/methylation domain-containing protein
MSRGFTLVELMIALAIGMILLSVVSGVVSGYRNSEPTGQLGIRSFCVEGYKFLRTTENRVVQVLDSQGRGVRCTAE